MQITKELVAPLLPSRPLESNKGSFGRVLVVAGSRTMCGAGFLCAKSALVSGAGVVFWALPKSMQPYFAAALPEVITIPLPEDSNGYISESALSLLEEVLITKKISLTVIGPGMGDSSLLPKFLSSWKHPLVVDADALNAMGNFSIEFSNTPKIFTPHPVEMARVLKTNLAFSRQEQLSSFLEKYQGVCLLKGHETLVASSAENDIYWQNITGNTALSKGGSGDVLAGIIAGLWAQLGKQTLFDNATALKATLCGVYLHGLVGEITSQEKTEYAVLSTDLISCLPKAFKIIKED